MKSLFALESCPHYHSTHIGMTIQCSVHIQYMEAHLSSFQHKNLSPYKFVVDLSKMTWSALTRGL